MLGGEWKKERGKGGKTYQVDLQSCLKDLWVLVPLPRHLRSRFGCAVVAAVLLPSCLTCWTAGGYVSTLANVLEDLLFICLVNE